MVGTANFKIFLSVTGFKYTFWVSKIISPLNLYLVTVCSIIIRTVTVQSIKKYIKYF